MRDVPDFNLEIHRNRARWDAKPVLRLAYLDFYRLLSSRLRRDLGGEVVELGSGIGMIKEVIPDCVTTDIFDNPWIERVENAYRLGFPDASVSNLILFDVFHHLRYPGDALREFNRVLVPSGRVLIFEPAVSCLGRVVYGLAHPEPLGLSKPIQWHRPGTDSPEQDGYYAAQGNASRIFSGAGAGRLEPDWRIIEITRLSAISYVAGGGFSRLQLYPLRAYALMKRLDTWCDRFPDLFATRMLVVLEKTSVPVIPTGA